MRRSAPEPGFDHPGCPDSAACLSVFGVVCRLIYSPRRMVSYPTCGVRLSMDSQAHIRGGSAETAGG